MPPKQSNRKNPNLQENPKSLSHAQRIQLKNSDAIGDQPISPEEAPNAQDKDFINDNQQQSQEVISSKQATEHLLTLLTFENGYSKYHQFISEKLAQRFYVDHKRWMQVMKHFKNSRQGLLKIRDEKRAQALHTFLQKYSSTTLAKDEIQFQYLFFSYLVSLPNNPFRQWEESWKEPFTKGQKKRYVDIQVKFNKQKNKSSPSSLMQDQKQKPKQPQRIKPVFPVANAPQANSSSSSRIKPNFQLIPQRPSLTIDAQLKAQIDQLLNRSYKPSFGDYDVQKMKSKFIIGNKVDKQDYQKICLAYNQKRFQFCTAMWKTLLPNQFKRKKFQKWVLCLQCMALICKQKQDGNYQQLQKKSTTRGKNNSNDYPKKIVKNRVCHGCLQKIIKMSAIIDSKVDQMYESKKLITLEQLEQFKKRRKVMQQLNMLPNWSETSVQYTKNHLGQEVILFGVPLGKRRSISHEQNIYTNKFLGSMGHYIFQLTKKTKIYNSYTDSQYVLFWSDIKADVSTGLRRQFSSFYSRALEQYVYAYFFWYALNQVWCGTQDYDRQTHKFVQISPEKETQNKVKEKSELPKF